MQLFSYICKPYSLSRISDTVFLNVFGAQESSPRNQFRQPMYSLAGRNENPIATQFLAHVLKFQHWIPIQFQAFWLIWI
jgi:hypothetical protein